MTFLALIIALAQAPASAAPPPPPPASEGMARSWREQLFVSPAGEPFRAPEGTPYPVATWFAQADTDHDGKLTEAELTADFLRFGKILDEDHDGVIEGTEVDAYESNMVPEVHTGATIGYERSCGEDGCSSNGPPADSSPMGAGRYGLLNIPEPVSAMDTDLNGRITRRELIEAASYRFSLLDPQGRGYLLLAELPQPYAAGHHEGRKRKRR